MTARTAGRAVDAALWLATAASLALVVVSSVGPAPPTIGSNLSDKIQHGAAYAALTLFGLLAAAWHPWRGPGRLGRMAWWIPGGAFLLGILFEVAQGSVSSWNRKADPLDVAANGLGVAAAGLAWLAWRSRAR